MLLFFFCVINKMYYFCGQNTYDMRRFLFLTLGFCVLALSVQAAPPLRFLNPMNVSEGTQPIMSHRVPVFPEGGYCASQSLIGEGNYLQHSGSPRILTILAGFQDLGFTVNDPVQAFSQYLNGDTQVDLGNMNQLNIASVRQYFEISSHGQFSPQFDIVGPVTLPQKMRYYGGSNRNGSDENFYAFCQDAVGQVKDLVNDWSVYDNDSDGRIELVCVIFAGYGQNQGGADSAMWAKASYMNQKLNDSLLITRFNCCCELFNPSKSDKYDYSQYINGTGVFIHEFSHCMGLPDLYATTSRAYVNNQGMESWSIMDYGLYNCNGFAPSAYTAWEQEVMGWTEIEPIDSTQVTTITMLPLIEGGKAYKFVNSNNDCDYIVMENIQKRGLNTYSNGHGMLVYHVDYPYPSVKMNDSPNNTPGHPSVAVVPAGGLLISSFLRGSGRQYSSKEWKESIASSPFPGTGNVTELYDQMQLPNYCFYHDDTKISTGFRISDISENSSLGYVDFTASYGEMSGIDNVILPQSAPHHPVYDLQGRHIQGRLKAGVYFRQGKKVLVK